MKYVSKKGFTLTEMMIVIAIIVIIAGAVAAGIAIDINRYNSFLDGQKAKYADGDDYMHDDSLWEAQARREVHNIYDSAQSANAATMASNSAAAAESEAAAAAASASYAAAHPSAAASSSAASTSSAAASTSSAAAKTTQAAQTTQASSGGGGNSVGNPSGTTGVTGSSCGSWGNAWNAQFSIGTNAKEFTFYVPFDGITDFYCNTGNCSVKKIDSHHWTVTMSDGCSANSSSFGLGGNVNDKLDMTKVKIVSYVPA